MPQKDDEKKRRLRMRNWGVFWILIALVVLVYAISIIRMSGS